MGTYIPNKQTRQETQKLRVQRTEAYAQRVKSEFQQAVNSILELKKTVPKLDTGVMYSFDGDTKKVQRQVNTILRQLHSATLTTIKTGVTTEWEQANKEADAILTSALGKKAINNPELAGWFDRNEKAMDAFLARHTDGMTLSDRVWKNTQQFREEMEVAMTVAIGEGESASQMSRKVRQYLDNPDLMFRRFRYKDEDGNWQLKWKKRVMDDDGRYHFVDYDRNSYKTGAGVYKSSYKNAMRVTRTETNMAYRRADHDRWQGMEFVLGQKIETSNAHDPEDDRDICDELAGNYPKEFVFDGWHPQCMCMCTAIMVSEEEMVARMQARLRGEEYQFKEKPITEYPKGFRDFVKNNRQNIIDAQARGKEPYFLANNAGVVNTILGEKVIPDTREEDKSLVLSIQERADIRHAQRTPEQIRDIKDRWDDSRYISHRLDKLTDYIPDVHNWYGKYGVLELESVHSAVKSEIKFWREYPLDEMAKEADEYVNRKLHRDSQAFKASDLYTRIIKDEQTSAHKTLARWEKWESDWMKTVCKVDTVVGNISDFDKAIADGKVVGIADRAQGMLSDKVLFNTASQSWLSSPKNQKDGIWAYTEGSGHLNKPAQGRKYDGSVHQTLQEYKDEMGAVTRFIDKQQLPHDMILKRTDEDLSAIEGRLNFVGKQMPKNIKDLEGMEVQDMGFMSTTTSLDITFNRRPNVIMKVLAPKGTKAAYVEPYSYYGKGGEHDNDPAPCGRNWDGVKHMSEVGQEAEATLQRGTSYVIDKVEEIHGKTYIWCRVTGQTPSDLSYIKDENLSH